jgi:hypothetical protein
MTSRSDKGEAAEVAEALLVLREMAVERGVVRLADLGNLPPLDLETKARHLARAHARERLAKFLAGLEAPVE